MTDKPTSLGAPARSESELIAFAHPRPWNWEFVGANASGGGHIYLTDANGRKIAALWDKADEKASGGRADRYDRQIMRAVLMTSQPPELPWRCFHCDDVFTERAAAQEHFGYHLSCDPACKLNAMQGGLIKIVRKQEEELDRFRAEETASYREFYRLGADHARALQTAEEQGYKKGLADGRNEAAAPPPGAAP